jgi:hypothetical protein
MMKYIPFAVVIVILAAGTLIEGKFSDRWGRKSSEKLEAFTARLKDVPMNVGGWDGEDDAINEEEFKASNCAGCLSRTYRNREGQQVNVYVVSGTARHVTIHTPDWCYVGAGYKMEMEPQQYSMTEVPLEHAPEFLTTRFLKETALDTHRIRIFWSFSDNGDWIGPRMPKPAFAGKNAMYKIYMITQIDGQSIGADIENNPTLNFAKDFFPVLNKVLFKENDDQM